MLAACALAAACASRAEAHGVYVFAYASGDEICTESYFTRKDRVIGGKISMSDASGNELASASTGEDGNHCFKAPQGEGDLTFIVLAGEGHRGEFTFPAADRPRPAAASPDDSASAPGSSGDASGSADTSGNASGSPDTSGNAPGSQDSAGAAATAVTASGSAASAGAAGTASGGAAPAGLSADAARSIVREELKAQIGPLARALAEAREDKTPGLREIVGGLGWLAGISGLVLWLKRRPELSAGRKD
jgi:nickel transport protein